MLNNQKQNWNLVKYFVISTLGIISSFLTYHFFFFDFLKKAVKIGFSMQARWMTISNSLGSWLFSATYVFLMLLGLSAPFILIIVIFLQKVRPQWLPEDDPYFLEPLHLWMDTVFIIFALLLTTNLLESIGLF